MSISLIPRGRTFLRSAIVRAIAGNNNESIRALALGRWGAAGELVEKTAVAAITGDDIGTPPAQEFFSLVQEQSLFGRINLRRVPFNVRLLAASAGATGYWTGQANPRPISKPALSGSTLLPLTVNTIICATNEALRASGELAEAELQNDIVRACRVTLDEALIDDSNAGVTNEMPASITYGAPSIASSGNPATDIAALIDSFSGDLASAVFVTDPYTATAIALARDAGGGFMFPDLGPRGGSVIGIPVQTSLGSPRDSGGGQIALIDGSGIAFGIESLAISPSDQASLAMADNPSGAAQMVSLFQTNSTAFLATIYANWEVQRSGGVVVCTGASYSTVGA
jgi:HK97 family phage major capsid protein